MTKKPTVALQTRRERIATEIANGMATNSALSPEIIADFSVRTADALIARLERPEPGEPVQ